MQLMFLIKIYSKFQPNNFFFLFNLCFSLSFFPGTTLTESCTRQTVRVILYSWDTCAIDVKVLSKISLLGKHVLSEGEKKKYYIRWHRVDVPLFQTFLSGNYSWEICKFGVCFLPQNSALSRFYLSSFFFFFFFPHYEAFGGLHCLAYGWKF